MIEVGKEVFSGFDGRFESSDEVVKEIYRRMMLAKLNQERG